MIVEGMVQRVGFRRFVERSARKFRLSGNVKSERNGTVRIFVQGPSESIQAYLSEIRAAPEPIAIDNIVEREARPIPSLKHFGIKTGPLAEEIQEGFGAMESQFMDYRGEFRDYRQEFRSFAARTDENFSRMDQKYYQISIRLAEILEALRTENRQALNELKDATRALIEAVNRIPEKRDQSSPQ